MRTLSIRDAAEADIPAILELCIGGGIGPYAEPADCSDPVFREAFRNILSRGDRLILAEQHGQPVGTLQIIYVCALPLRGMKRAILEHVHVRADRRGQGIGKEMVRWAIEEARRAGCGTVTLSSHKSRLAAHRFYRDLGFEQSGEHFRLNIQP